MHAGRGFLSLSLKPSLWMFIRLELSLAQFGHNFSRWLGFRFNNKFSITTGVFEKVGFQCIIKIISYFFTNLL